MLNQLIIHGRLTKDPELRRTQAGIAVATTTVACDRDFKNEKGEKEADFIDVVAWRGTGEFLANYFKKGQEAVFSGRLQIRKWTDNQGNKRSTAEIVADKVDFCGSRNDGGERTSAARPSVQAAPDMAADLPLVEGDDEELPF